jgi:hypothetical protein
MVVQVMGQLDFADAKTLVMRFQNGTFESFIFEGKHGAGEL